MKALSRITFATAPSISPLMFWYWSCRSANGTAIGSLSVWRPVFALFRHLEQARRIAGIGARRHDVLGYHRTRADDHIVGDPDRHDRGVGTDRDAIADRRLAPELFVSLCGTAGREGVIDEHHA